MNHMTKANEEIKGKPPLVWLEGILDYFNAPIPDGQDDPRRLGFNIGAQIVGLYLAEMLLQYKLDDLAIEYEHDHNNARRSTAVRIQHRSANRRFVPRGDAPPVQTGRPSD